MGIAVVKANTPGRARGLFGIKEDTDFIFTQDAHGVRLKAVKLQRLSAKSDDDTSWQVKPNTRCLLVGPELKPIRYHFLISYNPELLKYGTVSCPSFAAYNTLADSLQLGFTASAGVDLSTLDYIFELRVLD